MVNLFLKPSIHDDPDKGESQRRIGFLQRVEPIIWEIITAYGPSEVRLWLCNSIGAIDFIPGRDQSALFLDILHARDKKGNQRKVATQILRMLCENAPEKVGKIIANKSRLLQKFFKGHSRRILQWFDHFSGYSASEHNCGARSISQFAFVNRDLCWDELEWKGRHGQSPAMVATKPHYFQDLDVLGTVENLLEHVPQFWSSEECRASVRDGEILSVDKEFFVQELLSMMYNDDSLEVWQAVEAFLMEETFLNLCQRLLIHLNDRELFSFLNAVQNIIAPNYKDNILELKEKATGVKPLQFNLLETIMCVGMEFKTIDELLLPNACVNHGRQILRLLKDVEHEERKNEVDKIVLEMKQSSKDSDHWALRRECRGMNKILAIKLLAVESWILHYCLSDECVSAISYDSLLTLNGIEFRCPRISMVISNEFSHKEKPLRSSRGSKKRKRKDKSRKRKRNKLSEYNSSSSDEDMDEYGQWTNSEEAKWQLSTDNYTSYWNKVDLPEHLAKYAFFSWLKGILTG